MQQFVDALGQRGPMGLGQVQVAAQVEQGALLDDMTDPGAVHQAVGDVGFARDTIASLGAANKHVRDDARKIGRFVYCYKIMALHFASGKKSNDINDLRASERGNQRKVDKLGPSKRRSKPRARKPAPIHDFGS
ncbi:hypothetical protein [Verminephrobacter aporrectodeae]|uniref:hypothetical protein n=1 Tax=Verminephrobacter aporrectodeae TaxID=1110389 RepID=UPI002243173E|nr:hypothetical protein [Verminephrobacter aporrectodeae]